jgi:hypothetical protein
MATPSQQGDYVDLGGAHVWWTSDSPDEIQVTSDDPDLHHPSTGPGMRIVFSANPRSANYHPANFNRCRQVLLQYGKSAPPEPAVEGDRRLDRRPVAGFHIEMVKRETEKRSSYNVYLVNGSKRFLCNNRPVDQAHAYAEGLQAILTPGIQTISALVPATGTASRFEA